MTRDEQIITEAKKHYYDDINCHNAFLHGVEWADEHPANVWHYASEHPTGVGAMLYRTTLGSFELVVCGTRSSEDMWKVFVKDYGVAQWAYVSDLLPKTD